MSDTAVHITSKKDWVSDQEVRWCPGCGDYGIMHELAHLWWGERITGAQMQGRWMLTENLADYSALMLFRDHFSSTNFCRTALSAIGPNVVTGASPYSSRTCRMTVLR